MQERTEFYTLKSVDANNDEVREGLPVQGRVVFQYVLVLSEPDDPLTAFRPCLSHTITTGPNEALHVVSMEEIVLTKIPDDGRRVLQSYTFRPAAEPKMNSSVIWKATGGNTTSSVQQTCILALDLDTILLGYADGRLCQTSLASLCAASPTTIHKTSTAPINGGVTGLHGVVQNSRTRERFVIGGGDDGSIAFWATEWV